MLHVYILLDNLAHIFLAERASHLRQKPMMTWQMRRFFLKWLKEKTRGLLVSGALAGSALLGFLIFLKTIR